MTVWCGLRGEAGKGIHPNRAAKMGAVSLIQISAACSEPARTAKFKQATGED